tara:strand:- start:550 stop:1884 length:1335 start_codon:yes stop_codon:yes gene_type:complete
MIMGNNALKWKFNSIIKLNVFLLAFMMNTLASANDLSNVEPEAAGYDSAKLQSLTEDFDILYEEGLIPNYVIAIAKDGQIFYEAVRGDSRIGSGNAVNLQTIYPLASMTKPLVSVAIMRLIEEERLTLNSTLGEFFPQFENMFVAPGGSLEVLEEANRKVEIVDLLTHTSGFTYGTAVTGVGDVADLYDEFRIINKCLERDENLEIVAQLPLVAQPGSAFNYSISTDILGAIIEVITDKKLGEYLEEILFEPLGMTEMDFTLSADDLANNWAMIYGEAGPGRSAIGRIQDSEIDWKLAELSPVNNCPTAMTHEDSRYKFDSGGGGIHGSARDYLIFMTMIMNGGEYKGVRVISESSIDFMLTEYKQFEYPPIMENSIFGAGFGMDLELDDSSVVDFYRWGGAFNTGFWMDPVDRSVGVLFTSTYPGRFNLINDVEQIVDEARIQ